MNDIITPMEFDITKRLHGHVRVETRSRWTGRVVDSQEKENLVTNALSEIIQLLQWLVQPQNAAQYQPTQMLVSPIPSRALGGLLLFDNTLTEQASNIEFPANAKLVGYAGQDSSSSDGMHGSFNAVESTFISNGFTTVWDFLTSQANGTIASLARTSYKFVDCSPYYYFSSANPYFAFNLQAFSGKNIAALPLGYDKTNGYLYYTANSTVTIDGVQYKTADIYKTKIDLNKISLISGIPAAAQMTLVKTLTSSDGSANANYWGYDEYDNKFYYFSGNTLHLVSAADGTHTTKTLGGSGSYFSVTENYYWRGNGGSSIYRISKANLADVTTISLTGFPTMNAFAPAADDVMFMNGSGYIVIYPDGTIKQLSSGTSMTGYQFRKIGDWIYHPTQMAGQTYTVMRNAYLGTIANLDSPVTKTSSQTMKITYTLTEA